MNIDDIEANLNNHEADPNRVIAIILNTVVKNQALLESIFETQTNMMALIMPGVDFDALAKEVSVKMQANLARIQAEISAQF